MKHVSNWRGIEEFLAVVSYGSFSAAGDELGVSKSYVSKTVRELEERLGVQLLLRTTRSLSLTGAGETFHRECAQMQGRLLSLEKQISRVSKEPIGRLRVGLSGSFGVEYMAAFLAEFSRDHPAIKVEAITYMNEKEVVQERYDIVVRYGELKDSNLRARKFGYLSHCLCASPDYVRREGWPESVEDLHGHHCLTDMTGSINFNDGSCFKADPYWMSNSAIALRGAVRHGLGVASLPVVVVRKELLEGSIVALQEEWSYFDNICWMVYSPGIIAAGARAFIDFLVRRTQHVKIRPDTVGGIEALL